MKTGGIYARMIVLINTPQMSLEAVRWLLVSVSKQGTYCEKGPLVQTSKLTEMSFGIESIGYDGFPPSPTKIMNHLLLNQAVSIAREKRVSKKQM